MLFLSLKFMVFFPAVVCVYYALPRSLRNIFLVGASYLFYMCWSPAYAGLIFGVTAVSWLAGMLIGGGGGPAAKKAILAGCVVFCAGLLFVFKYYDFFAASIMSASKHLGAPTNIPLLKLLLPVGISFYAFQAIGYVIDVHRGKVQAEKNPIVYSLFICFFPQLLAGPIGRAASLMPQFREHKPFDYELAASGCRRMLWGFFKKAVIADRLAGMVNPVFAEPTQFSGPQLFVASLFFTIQIYCDFSGYSDIAIGTGRLLGVRLMENFKLPYYAADAREFWQRWHISLSTWFRDYLYIPLGGNRVSKWRMNLNLMIVFMVSGLWHGANWTFVAWGTLHGAYLVASGLTEYLRNKIAAALRLNLPQSVARGLKIFATFALVSYAWIYFKANTIGDALYITMNMFTGWGRFFTGHASLYELVPSGMEYDFAVAVFFIAVMEVAQLTHSRRPLGQRLLSAPALPRWAVYYAALAVLIVFGEFGLTQFIYFQF